MRRYVSESLEFRGVKHVHERARIDLTTPDKGRLEHPCSFVEILSELLRSVTLLVACGEELSQHDTSRDMTMILGLEEDTPLDGD